MAAHPASGTPCQPTWWLTLLYHDPPRPGEQELGVLTSTPHNRPRYPHSFADRDS